MLIHKNLIILYWEWKSELCKQALQWYQIYGVSETLNYFFQNMWKNNYNVVN